MANAAFEQGLQWGEKQAALGQEHKQALSDAELEQNIGDANDNITGFRKQLSDLAPGTAEHEQAKLGLQNAIQARTQLFHPNKNPTAMTKFGHMLLDHVPGHQAAPPPVPVNAPTIAATPAVSVNAPGASSLPMAAQPVDRSVIPMNRPTPAVDAPASSVPALGDNSVNLPQGSFRTVQGPQTPQQMRAQAQANLVAGSVPGPTPGALTPEEEHAVARVQGGLDPRAAPDKPDAPLKKTEMVPGHDAQGNPVMGYVENGKFVPVAGTTVAPPKPPPQSNSALSMILRANNPEVTDGKYTKKMVDAALVDQKRLTTPGTNSSHEVITYDDYGNASIATLDTSSRKTFGDSGGGTPSSAGNGTAGSKPGGKTRTVGTSGGGGSNRLTPLPGVHRNTTAQSKSNTDVVDATKLNSVAQQVLQHPHDAVNQKRLAVALERMSAGRFTTQALDYIIKAGWGNTIEQWANNPTTGELPADIVRQLVDGASQNLQASKDARTEAYQGSAATPGEMKDKAKGNTISDDDFLKGVQ